jgi:hypothetical protein
MLAIGQKYANFGHDIQCDKGDKFVTIVTRKQFMFVLKIRMFLVDNKNCHFLKLVHL